MGLLADSCSPGKTLSESRNSKLNFSRHYAEIYGKTEFYGELKKPRLSYEASVPIPSGDKKLGKKTVGQLKELLKSDSEELEADDDDDVRILSPAEWSMLHKEKFTSHKSNGNKIVDFQAMSSVGTKSDQQRGMSLFCKTGQREKSCNELINMQMGKHGQPEHANVVETLKLFRDKYLQLKKCKWEIIQGQIPKPAHTEAGELIKKMGMSNLVDKPFGHIPGIEIGDTFRFRAELVVVGLHNQFTSGISYVQVSGKICATSVVESGQYENVAKKDDVLIYSGQGGNPKLKGKASDQKPERGNLALLNSKEMGYPVRVIFKRRNMGPCRSFDTNNVYMYDGLYSVNECWQKRGEHGKLVFKFELRRLKGQPRPRETLRSKMIKRTDVCVLNDVSRGKEKFPVRVVNGVDDEPLLPFTYITKSVYPYWFKRVELIGCDCKDGCSNLKQCPCALRNVGEDGAILGANHVVHECGPSCRCPPSCVNRVSQHGPHYQMEIFRTKSRGWGVRSRNYISKGSFVCEYVGELLRVKEVRHKIGRDECLFYIGKGHYEQGQGLENGFALDSTRCGNIGRFINHSCSPNLIAKEVFYDHGDKRVPHIMFFASKSICPSQELTCDYMKTKDDG